MNDHARKPGQRFRDYDLLRRLGEGGMGEVWQARLQREYGFEKLVAVKMMRAGHVEDESAVRMFLDEARLAANINSPHVVSTLDLGIGEDDELFIVMEFVDGLSLARVQRELRRRGESMPLDVALEMLRQVAKGLHDAHEAVSARGQQLDLIHRDVSPDNILVGWDGWTKLTDFGVASGEMRLAASINGEVKGKLAYASPEQLRAEPLSRASDLFGLGVVAWEVLTGSRLFHAEHSGAVLVQVLTTDAPDVRAKRPEVGAAVAECIASALRRDVQERMPNAALFAEAMSEALRATVAGAGGPERVSRFLKGLRSPPVQKEKAQPLESGRSRTALRVTDASASDAGSCAVETKAGTEGGRGKRSGVTYSATPLAQTNLSSGLDSFVGRLAEVRELSTLLRSGARLVTLTGMGGTGKTRLAKKVGRSLVREFPGGVWFCDLTAVQGRAGIIAALAEALGVQLIGSDPEAKLRSALASRRRSLIILDNFEHLLECGSATVGEWMGATHRCRFLVTSRASLAIGGECIVPLAPLSDADGVELFFARALTSQPSMTRDASSEAQAREIVRALDGLSLAIELAAARLRFLSLEEIQIGTRDRFALLRSKRRDLDARQRTLWGTFEWSWELLGSDERCAFVQLAVFADRFDAEAFQAVVQLPAESVRVAKGEVLESLVDQSLVQLAGSSDGEAKYYRLLVSVRSYAERKAELWPENDLAAVRTRYCQHYVKWASEIDNQAGSSAQNGNLESAYRLLAASKEWSGAATLALVLGRCVLRQGSPGPALERLRSIELEGLEAPVRMDLIRVRGALYSNANRPDDAMADFNEGLLLAQEFGVEALALPFLQSLAWEYRIRSDVPRAMDLLQQCMEIGIRSNFSPWRLVSYGIDQGGCYLMLGEFERAFELFSAAVECSIRENKGNLRRVAMSNLARLHIVTGALEKAERLLGPLKENLEPHEKLFGYVLSLEAMLHEKRGDAVRAERDWRRAAAKLEDFRPPFAGACLSQVALLLAERGEYDEAKELMERGSSLVCGKHDVEETKLLARQARLQALMGDEESARASLAVAQRLCAKMGALPISEVGQVIALAEAQING